MTAAARRVAAFFKDVDISNAKLTRVLADDCEVPSTAERSDSHTLRIDYAHAIGFMWRCSCAVWGTCDTADLARREYATHADWASRVEAGRASSNSGSSTKESK